MTKKNMKQAKTKRVLVVKRKNPVSTKSRNSFGAVTAISTAPVAIGNSIKGSSLVATRTSNGYRVQGRDFCFSPIGSGSVLTWTLVGGTPLCPAAFGDSSLRQYQQMYNQFKFNRLVAHYITSSSTSSTGDVMFYYGKQRDSVFLNQTSSNLLPFVMSDENTVLGPQWTNHSCAIEVNSTWKSTDYGMSDDITNYSAGELFLLSKTSTTDSPGYVIFDYDIEFRGYSIIPRLLTLPISRIQWSQVNVGLTGVAVTNATVLNAAILGNNISGTASTGPSGYGNGDLYKVIIDKTNSASGSWTNGTPASTVITCEPLSSVTNTVVIQDGTTIYARYESTNNNFIFYPNATSAYAAINPMYFGSSSTITFNYQIWISYIGSMLGTNLNPNF